jgi:phosphoribosylformylglycinamidine (FGAM) synthase PurS component
VVGSSIGSSIGKPIGFNIDGSSTSAPVVLTEITEVIAASSDDGFIREEFYYGSPSTTAFTSTNDEMKVGHEDNDMGLVKYFWSFLRFTTIDIPQGSTIASAKIQMKYSGFQSNSVGETIKISAEDVDDATAPTNTSAVINATLTTANSTWTIPSMTTNTYYDSQDITGVIQEIVDRAGWTANNDINIILHDASTSADWYARWWSHNKGAVHAPKLVINYS